MSDVGTPPITLPSPVDIHSITRLRRTLRTDFRSRSFRSSGGYCGSQGGGPLGAAQLILTDDNGDQHRFIFETFFNRYDAQTLGVYSGPELRTLAASA